MSSLFKKLVGMAAEATTVAKRKRVLSWAQRALLAGQLTEKQFRSISIAIQNIILGGVSDKADKRARDARREERAGRAKKKPTPKKRRRSHWSARETKERQHAVQFYLNNGMSPKFLRAAMAEFERRLRAKR